MNQLKKAPVVVLVTMLLCLSVSLVWAGPQMSISMATSKEVVEIVKGSTVKKYLPTKTATSGDVLQYTLTYTNRGNDTATNAVVDNPVPKGTTYIANSAVGANTEITFSNDGGKTYAPPVRLTYEVKLPSGKIEKKVSTPSDYTNIRWTLKRVAPGESGTVAFSVHVK